MAKKRKTQPKAETPPPRLEVPGAADVSLYGSADSANWTKADIQNATGDAIKLMQDSAILRTFVHLMIFSRQIYLVAREQVEAELTHGWTVRNQRLVSETLVQSAQNKAMEKFTMAELREAVNSVVQTLDILCEAEQEKLADDARRESTLG